MWIWAVTPNTIEEHWVHASIFSCLDGQRGRITATVFLWNVNSWGGKWTSTGSRAKASTTTVLRHFMSSIQMWCWMMWADKNKVEARHVGFMAHEHMNNDCHVQLQVMMLVFLKISVQAVHTNKTNQRIYNNIHPGMFSTIYIFSGQNSFCLWMGGQNAEKCTRL